MAKEFFKLNVKAQIKDMGNKGMFRKPGEDQTMAYRIAPPVNADMKIVFHRVKQHWGLQDADGNNIAVANLGVHGTDETGREDYIEKVSKAFKGSKSKMLNDIGDNLRGNNIYHAQGFEVIKQDDGSFKYEQELSFLSVPVTASTDITENILQKQEFMNSPLATDPEKGQPVLLTRTGKGFKTKYSAAQSGLVESLDDVVPGWLEKLKDDVLDACNLKIYMPEKQREIVRTSYPDLDWESLEDEYELKI